MDLSQKFVEKSCEMFVEKMGLLLVSAKNIFRLLAYDTVRGQDFEGAKT